MSHAMRFQRLWTQVRRSVARPGRRAAVFFLLAVSAAGAEGPAMLTGKVEDGGTGEPLERAQVFIVGTDLGGVTNSAGDYRIRNVAPGLYILRVASPGYRDLEIGDVEIPESGTVVHDALLTAMPGSEGRPPGSISGKVLNRSENGPLVGANVLLVGTQNGAVSDLDGAFSIRKLTPGKYKLRFSYISYQPLTVDEVVVRSGADTQIDVALSPSVIQMKEVVITAEALKSSELSVLTLQKNADRILDGVSAELIRRNNSSDGTDVLKRMTGVTIADGRYATVRGVGDRYNNTLLNGSSLPSTDPEKKSFSYDLFPATLIENLITSKTATADKPADFSGGLVEIQTIEFPASRILSLSGTTGINTETTFKGFETYSGGGLDWLGLDDGARSIPGAVGPDKVGKGRYTADQLKQVGLGFANNWETFRTRSPLMKNFKIGLGNSYAFEGGVFGAVAALNYSNQDDATRIEKSNYTFEGPRYQYRGTNYANSVTWSGMLNLSLKMGRNHKLSLKNLYSRNSEDETTLFEGPYYYFPDYRRITSMRFVTRDLASSQFVGEHHFRALGGMSLDWSLNAGRSNREEPDARRYVYNRELDQPEAPLRLLLDPSLTTRFFGDLEDRNAGAGVNLKIRFSENPALPDLKTGLLLDWKDRRFSARTFGFWNVPGGDFIAEDNLMTGSMGQIFSPGHFDNRFLEVLEITKPADSYDSDQAVRAAYATTGFELWRRLKVNAGLRYEYSRQTMRSLSITNEPVRVSPAYRDWLPSLNLAWALGSRANVRAAYGQTLARPEFREMAPFSYFDFLANELVQGNPALRRSRITNLDLRFELFPSRGQVIAVSGFYKKFKDPIEQVLIAASGFEPIRTYENADGAVTRGIEMELRKKLDFLWGRLDRLSFIGNISLIRSEINLSGENEYQEDRRPLQGQADYVSNLGLYYDEFDGRLSASVTYNKVGKRISRVGFANLGDIIEMPRDQVDVSVSQRIHRHLALKASVKDILGQDHVFVQKTLNGDKTAERRKTGRFFSLGFTLQ